MYRYNKYIWPRSGKYYDSALWIRIVLGNALRAPLCKDENEGPMEMKKKRTIRASDTHGFDSSRSHSDFIRVLISMLRASDV